MNRKVNEVLTRIRYKTENPEEIDKNVRQLRKLQKEQKEGTIVTEKQTKAGLERTTMQKSLNSKGVEQYRVQTDLIKQGPRFQMEYLGIMFAGMALNRATQGLLQTSKEWLGIQELLSTTAGVVMLPAMTDLLNNAILPLSEAFMNLPEPVQKLIGYLTLGASGVGASAMAFGQLMLALNSIKIAQATTGASSLSSYFSTLKKDIIGVSSKYSSMISKFSKAAGIGIALKLAYDDASEGQVTAAIGDAMMGFGFVKGGKLGTWTMAAGFTMKFLGDQEFQEKVFSVFWTILDKVAWFGEAIAMALTGRWDEIDWTFFSNLGDSANSALADLYNQGELTSEALKKLGKTDALNVYAKQIEEVDKKLQESDQTAEDWQDRQEAIDKILKDNTKTIEDLKEGVDGYNDSLRETRNLISSGIFKGILNMVIPGSKFAINAMTQEKSDAPEYAVGTTNVPRTGLAMVHQGETILRKDQSITNQGQSINITYQVNATSMKEVEMMLRESERRITQDIRRQVR